MTVQLFTIFAVFGLIAVASQRTAFFLFIGLLPTYLIRFTVSGIPTTALEVLFGILFVVWMLRREKRFIDISGWKLLLLFWLAAATIAVFVAPDMLAALGIWKAYFVEPVLFFIIANDIMRKSEDRKLAIISLAISAMAVGILAIIQRYTGWAVPPPFNAVDELRSTAFYGFPNAVGLFLAPMVPLFAGMLVTDGRTSRVREWFWASSIVISLFAIVSAKSEGALVGLAAGLFVFGFMFRRTRIATVLVASITAILLLIVPMTRPVIFEKVTLEDWSGRVRKEMWQETSAMLADRPIFGAGLSGYPVTFAPYHDAGHIEIFQYPHNIVLNFWSELGIFGVLVFIGIIVQFFRKAYRAGCNFVKEDPWFIALSTSMIVILVHGLVDVPYLKNDLSFQFWLIIALLSSATILTKGKAGDTVPRR